MSVLYNRDSEKEKNDGNKFIDLTAFLPVLTGGYWSSEWWSLLVGDLKGRRVDAICLWGSHYPLEFLDSESVKS